MGYNKAQAVRKWQQWKEKEEQQFRELGVDEATIHRLHDYDWQVFNRERQYLQRREDWTVRVEKATAQEMLLPVENVEAMLNSIDNRELLEVLLGVDEATLQILLYKIMGYNSVEIAELIGMKEETIRQRISRLKKKLRK